MFTVQPKVPYVPKVDFRFIESIIGPIRYGIPRERSREEVIRDILTSNDSDGMKKFMEQTNERCLLDVKRAMEQAKVSKTVVADLTGTQPYGFYWEPERLALKPGYKQNLGAIYLNCLQRPQLFEELNDVTPKLRKKNFTQKQTELLIQLYQRDQYPTRFERERIAQALTFMTPDYYRNEHSVMVWFQKRRRMEKAAREQAVSRPSSTASSLFSSSSSDSSSTRTTPMFFDMTIDD